MPIYEYVCENCGTSHERFFQSGGDAEKDATDLECENCGSYELRRVLSSGPKHKSWSEW